MEVIKVENLYKQYRLGQVSTGSIAHDLNRWWHTVRGKEDPYEKITGVNNREDSGSNDYVWALQDINFSVKQGEVLGIIGRNGAGKSTLLKILSKVTSPSKGNIKVRGRIASLLEVGTGFHPELTGRENIFLNGAILGMTKSEIRSKFDEIVAFSGVEKYIDTPVKRYSSGMYVRLAFAVAAHLEPEILIVDEVLAVGDAEFQKKCLGKMKDVSGEGRTVLFVSHNMAAVKSLCKNSLLLHQGRIISNSDTEEIIKQYFDLAIKNKHLNYKVLKNENIEILSCSVLNNQIYISDNVEIKMELMLYLKDKNISLSFMLYNTEDVLISELPIILFDENNSNTGKYMIGLIIPKNTLNAGSYYCNLIVGMNQKYILLNIESILDFEIINERSGSNFNRLPGLLRIKPKYEIHYFDT
jgi:lipopolysaccharide transport system ATP-binding protein